MADTVFNNRQLQAFVAVVSSGSITAAAKLVGRSQSAISRLVQDLEAELGFALLARNGRGTTVTRNGADFYKEVAPLVAGMLQARERAREIANAEAVPIRLSATPSLAASLAPRALALMERDGALPPRILLRAQGPDEIVQSVVSRTADVGVSSLPVDHPGLRMHWVGEAVCVCAMAADDPLATQEIVGVRQLANRRLITMSDPYRVLGRISQALDASDVRPRGMINTSSSAAALGAARAGLGVAIVEPLAAYGMPMHGLATRRLDVSIPYFWGIVTPSSLPETPFVEPLIEALIAAADIGLPGFRVRDPKDQEAILRELHDREAAFTHGLDR